MKTSKIILSLFGAAALAVAAQADHVTLDTSTLAPGTYYVDFQLNDGGGVNYGNNSAAIFNFDLGGGSAVVPTDIGLFGGASGDLSSAVWLTDTNAFNEFFQAFTPGNFLSFDFVLSNNFNGLVPDIFGFALLDADLNNLATFSFADQLLTVEINGSTRVIETFAGMGGLAAPQVPDYGSTLGLLAFGLAALGAGRRLRAA